MPSLVQPQPRRAPLVALLLGAVLLWTQTALAVHQLEHLVIDADEPCLICLGGVGIGSPLGAAAPLLYQARLREVGRLRSAPLVWPGAHSFLPQRARAPPGSVRC
ncbi:hypothetical protein [Marichromatium bheemlicum]|uniref:Uncharacterized protein n=1 Tax=Marichromatium bheemlicum TaxID=365339 RepID=A0ABX1I4H4_9GAMM|nr:hypothetical protein [Marichromatium bheemlicum]NKN32458.1 hypothetical protein [Marichromatium bheemlicum]